MNFHRSQITRFYLFRFFSAFHLFGAVIVPFFTDWAGLTLFHAQLLQAWFLFWVFILEIPTGIFADIMGHRRSLALGAGILIPATIVYGSIPNVYIFALGEFLFALSIAFMSGADEAWLKEFLDANGETERMKQIIGYAESLKYIAMMLAALAGSFIAARLDLNAPMYLTSLPATATLVIALSMASTKQKSKPKRKTKRKAKSNFGWVRSLLVRSRAKFIREFHDTVGFINHNQKLRRLSLNLVLVSTSAYFVIWLYQPLLSEVGVNVRYFGIFHSLLMVFEIAISSNYQRLEDWLGSANRYLNFSAILTTIGFMLVVLHANIVTVVLFLCLSGGFGLTRLQFAISHFHELIPGERRAAIRSALSMYRRSGAFLLNPIIGFMASYSLGLALLIAGTLPLIAALSPSLNQAIHHDH